MKNYLIGIVFLLAAFYLFGNKVKLLGSSQRMTPAWDENQSFLQIRLLANPKKSSLPVRQRVSMRVKHRRMHLKLFKTRQRKSLFEGMANEYSTLQFTNYSGGLRKIDLNEFERLSRQFSMEHSDEPFLGLAFH